MDLFELKFRIIYELDEEEIETEEDEGEHEMLGYFHLLGENFLDAMDEGLEYMEEHFEDVPYEIIALEKVMDIHIVNGPDQQGERPLMFRCSFCKENIVLPNDEWNEIGCPHCKKIITRDKIVEIGKNRWFMIPLKEEKE